MTSGVVVEPVLCSCGCGEATNAVVIEAQRLHDENGESWASASAKLGVSYAYIKTIRKNPAKSLRGHNRLPTSTERPCVICGRQFFSSLPPEKLNVCSSGFCTLERWKQRRVEWAANNVRMREVWRHRQLVENAARVRLRARRLLRHLERDSERSAIHAWRTAQRQRRIDHECQRSLDRVIRRALSAVTVEQERISRVARRQRRIDWHRQRDLDRVIRQALRVAQANQRHRTAEQKRISRAKTREEAIFWRTVGNEELRHFHRLAKWLEKAERKREHERHRQEQREQRRLERIRVKDLRQQQRERQREERRIRRAFEFGGQRERAKAHHGDEWHDDVFEEVADRIDVDEHQFLAFAKQAVFVPEDFYQKCRDGGLCLVVDDEGVRFLILRDRRTEIIPRFDPGVAIPTQASGSSGKKSSRHRGRHARSASAQGKRSSRSQPKVSR